MGEELATFATFSRIVARLRGPDGCPWDRKQTHESLKPYLMEEAYEVLQALEEGDADKLCEELGDLLLQIGLQAQIGSEAGEFKMADVLRRINEKLIRRHPHVFGNLEVVDAKDVALNWEEMKRREEGTSILGDLPKNIPALAKSQIIQQRAARVGFDWKEIGGVLNRVGEELKEIKQAKSHQQRAQEFGDLLFALTNAARWIGVDLEGALRLANERFCRRFSYIEEICRKQGIPIQKLSLEELDALWEEAKREEKIDRNEWS